MLDEKKRKDSWMEIREDDVERNEMDGTSDGKTPTPNINLQWPIICIA